MVGGFNLNSFRKGNTLTKAYIFEKMKGNPAYGAYVPDNINPRKLSREFLLTVNAIYNIYLVSCYCRSLPI